MGKLNLPDSMSSEDREAMEGIFNAATGQPNRVIDPEVLQDSITDLMASLGSQRARTRQITRKAEQNLAERLKERLV